MWKGDDGVDPPIPEWIFTELQETFQQQMWEGDCRVDLTLLRIFTEIQETFQQPMRKGDSEVDLTPERFSLKLRNSSTINTESDDGVNPTLERIFTEVQETFQNKCGKWRRSGPNTRKNSKKTFQQQTLKGDDEVDPTQERIFIKIQETFQQQI
jgi:hypothetical protein